MTDTAMIQQTASLFFQPGTVTELRILNTPRGTVSGYFDNPQAFTQAAIHWSGQAAAVYCTLNPCAPALLARAANRLKERAKTTTSDKDIVQRCWFSLDFDPVRPADISSTEAEHDAALQRAEACTAWLTQRGWPAPVAADSGNGGHRLYRIDLPNDDDSRALLQRCLEALAMYFSDSAVTLDLTVFNASRIWKTYGTRVCKGDNLSERPHRLARLLHVPVPLGVVDRAQLERLATLVPDPPRPLPRARHHSHSPFDLDQWIADHRLPVVSQGAWGTGGYRWVLNPCPWNDAHGNRSAFVVRLPNGAIAAGCHHNSCGGRNWSTLRDLHEPGWHTRDAPETRHVGSQNGTTATQPRNASAAPASTGQGPTTPGATRQLRVTVLATVRPERVHWLWKPYLPLGRPVALEGDAGLGKSALVAKIFAHLTSGQAFPNLLDGQTPQPVPACNVCLLTSEDDPGDTILPRVAVNGGDPTRVYLIDGWHHPDGAQGTVTMQDLDLLKQALEQYAPKLLVFDPIQSYFGRRVDMNSASDTRPVLDAVIALCKAYACTPLFVRHIGKARRDKALYAGLGSIDIAAAMRSILLLGQDPDEESRRVLAQSKANNARLGPSMAYRIVSIELDLTTPTGDLVTVEAPRLDWDGLSPLTATDLASPPLPNDEETSALDQAKAFLVDLLTDGPILADEVSKAAKQAGFTMATLRRAKPLSGIKTRRRHLEGVPSREWPWEWYLAEDDSTVTSLDTCPDAHLEHLENLSQKSMAYEHSSRCASDRLETVTQPKEIQQLALDALDAHQHTVPVQTSSSDEDGYDEMII